MTHTIIANLKNNEKEKGCLTRKTLTALGK